MATMKHLREGVVDKTPEVAAALYACTGCLACTTACHHEITPGKHLLLGRAEAERDDVGHDALVGLPARVRAHSVKAVANARASLGDATRLDAGASATTAFLPACDAPSSAAAALTLFARLDGGPMALAPVTLGCGGYPLLAGGFPEAFRLHAEQVARELAGYERVIVGCPACAVTMSEDYARHGVPLTAKIEHTSEALAPLADRITIAATHKSGAAFYHDPCYLGRHRGTYDAPRALLTRAGVALREFSRNRADAECSGGGGVVPITSPDTASAIAHRRLEEVLETDVRSVVTACATCARQLTREGVTARDLVDVLEEATRNV
jgi:Fe-S oxidoreductase